MASLEKYTDTALIYELRHNTREHPRPPSNMDIDPSLTANNYFLSPPDRGESARANKNYYNQRLSEVYHYGRTDVKTACQWVITAPKDLPDDQMDIFFSESYNYLNSLYDERNCIQCVVHVDEGVKDLGNNIVAGRPHMHYMFVPVVANKKYMQLNKKGHITSSAKFREKVCADQLITKRHLQDFHPNFQRWMDDHGIKCTVHSGITGGNNRTVKDLKRETKERLYLDRIQELERENADLRARLEHGSRWDRKTSGREDHGRW